MLDWERVEQKCWNCKALYVKHGRGYTENLCTSCLEQYVRMRYVVEMTEMMYTWGVDKNTAQHAVSWAHAIAGTIDVYTSKEMVEEWAEQSRSYDKAMSEGQPLA